MSTDSTTVIAAERIFSPTLGLHSDWVVAVDKGRITYVGPRSEYPLAPGTRLTQLPGTLMPGFIDAHVHLLGGVTAMDQSQTRQILNAVRNCRRALAAGITTVADLGSRSHEIFALKTAIDEGLLHAPRIQAAGQAICMTGGHGRNAVSIEADGTTGIRREVRKQIGAGAAVIKLMATGGTGSPHEAQGGLQLDREELEAGVTEAAKAGVPVTAHATSTAGINIALDAGVRVIQHGIGVDADTAARIRELGGLIVPTLSVHLRSSQQSLAPTPKFMRDKAAAAHGAHKESFRIALAGQVDFGFGTDSGGEYHPLGDIEVEIELMSEAGMSSLDVLKTLTVNNAAWLGLTDETGDLRTGLAADLVLVDGNPESDVRSMTRTRAVWRAGELVHHVPDFYRSANLVPDAMSAESTQTIGGVAGSEANS